MEFVTKFTVLSAIFIAGVTCTQLDVKCPISTNVVYISYPDDCTKFVECFENTPYIISCPEGQFWNEDKQNCGNICKNSFFSFEAKMDSNNFGTDPTCSSTGKQFFPNYGNCHAFFECNDGVLSSYTCPTGAAWNVNDNACQPESEVDCSYVTSPNHDPDCPDNGISYLPNYGDCTKYYQCKKGVKTPEQCDDGEAWDIVVNTCNDKNFVDCSYTTAQPPAPTQNPGKQCPSSPANTVSYLPDAYNCSVFYVCYNGVKTQHECPEYYLWDNKLNKCELSNYVDCSYTSALPTVTPPLTTPKPTNAPNPAPTGVPTAAPTGAPTAAPTASPTAQPPPGPVTWPPDGICTRKPEGTMFPDPDDCTKYLECDQGKLITRSCAAGTSYNSATQNCDFNWDTNCASLKFKMF